ncbi:hypothetical protein B0H13DRAFT_1887083 [Mycena leptocephala]|nr:hypothetical protein B0H13DRAFT_1887083 [Mycena leptocephala]
MTFDVELKSIDRIEIMQHLSQVEAYTKSSPHPDTLSPYHNFLQADPAILVNSIPNFFIRLRRCASRFLIHLFVILRLRWKVLWLGASLLLRNTLNFWSKLGEVLKPLRAAVAVLNVVAQWILELRARSPNYDGGGYGKTVGGCMVTVSTWKMAGPRQGMQRGASDRGQWWLGEEGEKEVMEEERSVNHCRALSGSSKARETYQSTAERNDSHADIDMMRQHPILISDLSGGVLLLAEQVELALDPQYNGSGKKALGTMCKYILSNPSMILQVDVPPGLFCPQHVKNIEYRLVNSRSALRKTCKDVKDSRFPRGIEWSNLEGKRSRTELATAEMVETIEKVSKRKKFRPRPMFRKEL